MKKVLDYDSFTGLKQVFHYDELTDKTTIETIQDVEPILEKCKTLRNDEDYSKAGMKAEMWHYCHIPNIVLHRIYQMNINPYNMNKEEFKRVIKLINTEYPALKVTNKKHG